MVFACVTQFQLMVTFINDIVQFLEKDVDTIHDLV